MKKIALSLLAIGLFITCFSQDYKKSPSLGFSYVLFDFKTATELRSSGLASVIRAKQWSRVRSMSSGFGATYYQGLSNHIDFAGTLAGAFIVYPVPGKPEDATENLLLDASATVNLKLATDRYWFTPFVTAGLGASKYKGYYGAYLPIGVGLQLNLWDKAFVFVNSQYRVAMTENANYHLYHSLGFASTLFAKKK